MKKSNSNLYASLALSAVSLTLIPGCSSLWNIDEDAPPPPPIREVRELKIPADLAVVRPVADPYTSAIVAAQANAAAELAARQQPAPAEVIVVTESQPQRSREGNNPKLFAPYFPSEAESNSPKQWQNKPDYAFPWIEGAEPTRVNEETVFGAGTRVLGRLFALVSYENNIPVTAQLGAPDDGADKASQSEESMGFFEALKKKFLGATANANGSDGNNASSLFVQCEAVTCLDAARDALVADAANKRWELLMSRRVGLHQSFQFMRDDRIALIEISSDGKKRLDLEYALVPVQ